MDAKPGFSFSKSFEMMKLTVVSVMQELAGLQLKEDEELHKYFFRAQQLSTRLEHAGEHLSEPWLNAMVLNGLAERYEHFVV